MLYITSESLGITNLLEQLQQICYPYYLGYFYILKQKLKSNRCAIWFAKIESLLSLNFRLSYIAYRPH